MKWKSLRNQKTHMKLQPISYFVIILPTTQKMKFSTKEFFSKCDQIRIKLRIWLHLLKKSLMENFTFFAVSL